MWFIGGLRSWELIKPQLRALKLREPSLSLVVIDYAQLLQVQEKERRLQIAKISAESKGLAMEFNAAVILLSQISRDVEKNQAKQRRPKLSDLLESSSLEQDADLVFLIHRERLEPNYWMILSPGFNSTSKVSRHFWHLNVHIPGP
jgi:replicative DNA helicase